MQIHGNCQYHPSSNYGASGQPKRGEAGEREAVEHVLSLTFLEFWRVQVISRACHGDYYT